MSWEIPNGFYVYVYLDENDIPYYVGMGSGKRAIRWHKRIELPSREKIVVVKESLEREEAWLLEKELIEKHGRKNIDENGILENILSGGVTTGFGWNHSLETKLHLSKVLTGKKKKNTEKYKKPKTEEHAENIRKARIGCKHKPESKIKISEKCRQTSLGYWAKVRSGEIVRKKKVK